MCALCIFGDHKNHSHLPITSVLDNAKVVIKDNLVLLQTNVSKIDEEIKGLEKEKKKLEEDLKRLEEKLKETIKKKNEESQKIEDLKSLCSKSDVDPYVYLQLIGELKLEIKVQSEAETYIKLAHQYRKGDNVKQNHPEALRLYQLAATRGDAEAEAWIAFCYIKGEGGIMKNDKEAFRLSKLGVEKKTTTCLSKSRTLLSEWIRCRKRHFGSYPIISQRCRV